MNSFGQYFRIHTFGESHGPGMGVVIDGCPAGLEWDHNLVKMNLNRRKPGQSSVVSSRQEKEELQIISGIYQGRTLGTPITLLVANEGAKTSDYLNEKGENKFESRMGHADEVWNLKYGHSDFRGGGRSSGRETLSRVLGGSVAQMLVQSLVPNTKVVSYVESIGLIKLDEKDNKEFEALGYEFDYVEKNITRMPSASKNQQAIEMLIKAKEEGQSYGGVACVRIVNPKPNLGQPVFKKLKSDLSAAYMSIGATTGIELGGGFNESLKVGTEFHKKENSSVYGGLRGGISTGEDIFFRVAFKPTSSVMDVAKKGRHDPCIVPRAVVVLEAMTYLVLADHLLAQRLDKINF